jgi:hypothetical protein
MVFLARGIALCKVEKFEVRVCVLRRFVVVDNIICGRW